MNNQKEVKMPQPWLRPPQRIQKASDIMGWQRLVTPKILGTNEKELQKVLKDWYVYAFAVPKPGEEYLSCDCADIFMERCGKPQNLPRLLVQKREQKATKV